jgi:sec-independent protein translocase protein TatA
MPGFIGFPELLLLGVVALLLFGPKRLPEMGRSLGKGLREFKDSVSGEDKALEPQHLELSTIGTTAPMDDAHQAETQKVA